MKYSLSNTAHYEFFEKLKAYDVAIDKLKLEEQQEDEQIFIDYSVKITQEIKEYFNEKILPSAEHFLALFVQVDSDFYYRFESSRYGRTPYESEKNRLGKFSANFKLAIGYLSVTDSLLNPSLENIIETVPEKIDFVLGKLNQLFDENYYSVSEILSLNSIPFRNSEPLEMAEDLVRRGYAKASDRYGEREKIQLTVKGANYVQRKNKQRKNTKSSTELERKLDEIIQHLNKLGFGQEIIFNEIEELRKLQNKLSKKTWGQLLKGKLFDLAVESVISKETAIFIYEYLTNGQFKILDFK